jgi:hypothetical protein
MKKFIGKTSTNQLLHVAVLEENYSLYWSCGSMAEAAGTSYVSTSPLLAVSLSKEKHLSQQTEMFISKSGDHFSGKEFPIPVDRSYLQ